MALKDQGPAERFPTLYPLLKAEVQTGPYAATYAPALAAGDVAKLTKLFNTQDPADAVQPVQVTRQDILSRIDAAFVGATNQLLWLGILLDATPFDATAPWVGRLLDKIGWTGGASPTPTRTALVAMVTRKRTRAEMITNEIGFEVLPADVSLALNATQGG